VTITPTNPVDSIVARFSWRAASSRRRCVTLLEVLVALALLAGLAALVMPSLFDRLDERAFEAAADSASEQLMMARAHAQATGEAVEVTYSPATGQVRARVYAPWSSEVDVDAATIAPGTSPLRDPSARQPASRDLLPNSASSADDDVVLTSAESSEEQDRVIAEPWATRELGSGMCFARKPVGFPYAAEGSGLADADHLTIAASAADDDIETLEDLEHGQEVRLAVFMPDGSALVGDDVFLNDQGGRCGRLSVNPWSGLPMFVRLADLVARSAESGADGAGQNDAASDSDAPQRSSRDQFDTGEKFDSEPGDDARESAAPVDWEDETDD
jgi:type II secretory pathway pseudopilin PulG